MAVIPDQVLDALAKGKDDLRAKRLLEVSSFDVEGFDVEAGGVKKAYGRSSSKDKDGADVSKWKRVKPDGKDLDTTKVQDALFLVGGVEVQEFVDKPAGPETYGLDHPVLPHRADRPVAGIWPTHGKQNTCRAAGTSPAICTGWMPTGTSGIRRAPTT